MSKNDETKKPRVRFAKRKSVQEYDKDSGEFGAKSKPQLEKLKRENATLAQDLNKIKGTLYEKTAAKVLKKTEASRNLISNPTKPKGRMEF